LGLGLLLILLGFFATGIMLMPAGPLIYYRYLMHHRSVAQRRFREQLPDAIHDFLQYFAIKKNIAFTVEALASKGPLALRPEFAQADSLIKRMYPVEASLEHVGQSRSEAFFRQFMDALAQHDQQGGDLKAVLLRIARAQRSQLRLHSRIAAQQSGARMVGLIYAIAPLAFLLFVRVVGGTGYTAFYATPLGQMAQVVILASGLASWWLTNRIAQRGLYLNDDPAAPALSDEVRQTGFAKPVLPKE
jgi:Flp pilus assembly protein TadB